MTGGSLNSNKPKDWSNKTLTWKSSSTKSWLKPADPNSNSGYSLTLKWWAAFPKKVGYLPYSHIPYIICTLYVFLYIALKFTGLQEDGREYLKEVEKQQA